MLLCSLAWVCYGIVISNGFILPANILGLVAGVVFTLVTLPYVRPQKVSAAGSGRRRAAGAAPAACPQHAPCTMAAKQELALPQGRQAGRQAGRLCLPACAGCVQMQDIITGMLTFFTLHFCILGTITSLAHLSPKAAKTMWWVWDVHACVHGQGQGPTRSCDPHGDPHDPHWLDPMPPSHVANTLHCSRPFAPLHRGPSPLPFRCLTAPDADADASMLLLQPQMQMPAHLLLPSCAGA